MSTKETTKEKLTGFLKKRHDFSPGDISLIHRYVEVRRYGSKEFFVNSGQRCTEVGFTISGVFRYFFYDAQGNEVTAHFMAENEFVGNVTSFFEFSPSAGSIQAEVDCEVIVISRGAWDIFCKEIPQWESTIQKVVNDVLLRKTTFQRNLINVDAQSAYLNFLNVYPTIAQRVALNHIASYLGMTPFSLSRIRKALATK
ncbi:Crp/Fnr family transcriptional regulator [Algoriphagus sp. H41]|uniref:Crp/Fnr family transcriptional regulator n=1 Tax=Algoriphagus oliviformis TaxID=2811231 RepID=A0ABS3CCI8_9BACT|nr:Crp/Fnr family transcriptional regulator [Algoriphagus oliviformis]MBN7813339.1 Crp/Fnr family transcriptional regulator [Algoriphagus oliviformis]